MRNPLSEKITSIKPSGIRKFFDIVTTMEGAISLGVGEPDFETPYFIREEAIHYNTVLLIDDFVGSGATLNETAIKLKTAWVKKIIGFAFFGNLDLKYEVINEM